MSLRLELDLEMEFREVAMHKYGYSKGALKKASFEAFRRWINEQKGIAVVEEPFRLIEGILKKTKSGSVELQHSAKKLWVK
ncbi:hypothetical protein J4409_00970 [Candidatus Woesearchaeota archaeon]|nr:hypothetical protein [Candidatus Woesearchaeota archaeon]